MYCKYFLLVCGCLSTFLILYSEEQEFLILMKYNLFMFLLWLVPFVSQEIFAYPKVIKIFPVLEAFSRSFIVLAFTFRPLIHLS